MRDLCRPSHAPESMVQVTKRVPRGSRLFCAGSRQVAIYALRSGCLMSCLPQAEGRRFVLRFLLPGDAAGMDAMATGVHPNEAIAIEESQVCVIPVRRAQVLAEFLPAYAAQLRRLLGAELVEAQAHAMLLRRRRADERVALFLIELARRSKARGFSATRLALPMRRYELAEHLGLRLETVGRTLMDFEERGAIEIERHTVTIRNLKQLKTAAGPAA